MVVIVLLVASFLLISCKKKGADANEGMAQYEILASGGSELENSNAKFLAVTNDQEKTTATFKFVMGSINNGIDEADAANVPAYRVYMLPSPSRLVIEFDTLDSWDYDRSFNLENDPNIYAVYKQYQINDDSTFRIMFQLKKDVTAQVSDKADMLIVEMTPKETSDKESFYVITDAVVEFNKGELTPQSGFFPILCKDEQNTLLLSSPFENQSEAEEFKNQVLQEYSSVIDPQMTFVIALEGNELPDYTANKDLEVVFDQKIIQRGSQEETLPVVMPDGMYLCTSLDGTISLFNKQLENDEQSDISPEELWILDSDGKLKRLSEIEFAMIDSAQFSPDGKRIAILERTSEISVLHVYNMETNTLEIDLGEEGFGKTTSKFTWDELGTAIYAITGDESQQLQKYDFTVADESMRVSAVEEEELTDGDLQFYNGELYFSNEDYDYQEKIFKIKPEGGLRTEFSTGGKFSISPNGKYMAIMETAGMDGDEEAEEESGGSTSLKIKDMITGEEKYIIQNNFVVNFDWSQDGYLYYSMGDDISQDYGFKLIRYDVASDQHQEIVRMRTSDFYTTVNPKLIYITYISEDEIKINATYKLTLE